jgi:hypothetical protein
MRPVVPKLLLTCNGLNGVISQKIELFIATSLLSGFCKDHLTYNLLMFSPNRKRPTKRYYVKTWPDIDMKHSSYDGSKGTVFLIHGFFSTGNDTWMEDMKNAYLNSVSDTSRSCATQ